MSTQELPFYRLAPLGAWSIATLALGLPTAVRRPLTRAKVLGAQRRVVRCKLGDGRGHLAWPEHATVLLSPARVLGLQRSA